MVLHVDSAAQQMAFVVAQKWCSHSASAQLETFCAWLAGRAAN